jgi:hypothetical protein
MATAGAGCRWTANMAGQLGATYTIPIVYVPMLMITHAIALYWLARPQLKEAQTFIGGAASS